MLTPTSTITQSGDLGGHKVKMSFDENSLAHLMSVLTDLYSDPESAVIREYATNARDAHIQAGKADVPIEIYTPNGLSPQFKIIDHGVGLSQSDIEEMYSKYGASSKRNTNDQVGMLGLGAKSALSLTPQFNLTSVKDGTKIYVSISRDANGSGEMEIIYTEPTDQPNGVEISIPVPRSYTFANKVRHFFQFWERGQVLVDGNEPDPITGNPVGDKFIINSNLDSDYVVMGGVPYPVKGNLYSTGYSAMGIVAKVNIGDVHFTPSREQLHYTSHTDNTIKTLRKEFSDSISKSVADDIDSATSYSEAWKKADDWRSKFPSLRDLTYKGTSIPKRSIPFHSTPFTDHWGYARARTIDAKSWVLHSKGRYPSQPQSLTSQDIKNTLYVVKFAASMKLSSVQREKAQIYCAQNNLNFGTVAITSHEAYVTDPDHLKFLDGMHVVEWSKIAKIKIARNSSGTGTVRSEPYDMLVKDGPSKQVGKLDKSKPIIFFSRAEKKGGKWLFEYFPDAQIVPLNANRWDKFKRDWPTAKHLNDAVKDEQKRLHPLITDSDKILWHHDNLRRRFKNWDSSKVDDPDLKKFINALSSATKYSDAAVAFKGLSARISSELEVEAIDNPLTKYPLSGILNYAEIDHDYWYVNNWYAYLTSSGSVDNINA